MVGDKPTLTSEEDLEWIHLKSSNSSLGIMIASSEEEENRIRRRAPLDLVSDSIMTTTSLEVDSEEASAVGRAFKVSRAVVADSEVPQRVYRHQLQ